jgi:hypothetical protein
MRANDSTPWATAPVVVTTAVPCPFCQLATVDHPRLKTVLDNTEETIQHRLCAGCSQRFVWKFQKNPLTPQ